MGRVGQAMEGAASPRVLVFGWGAAAEQFLTELSVYKAGEAGRSSSSASAVCCISPTSQASDCDLREVCSRYGFECVLVDAAADIFEKASSFKPDIIVSASYRKKIAKRVLDLCKEAINFHPSLLPKHRGCWSGFWCLFDGDTETGVTCHRMVEEFDAGLILHQEQISVAVDDTSVSIYKKLLPVTAVCARHVLSLYFSPSGLPAGQKQHGEGSYHFRKLPFDGLIQPEWDDCQVDRFIRAMHFPPFDGAAVLLGGVKVQVDSLEAYRTLKAQSAATAVAAATAASAASVAAAGYASLGCKKARLSVDGSQDAA